MDWIDVYQTSRDQPLLTAEAIRDFERRECERMGCPTFSLMTRAGKTAFAWLRTRWPRARQWLVVVGTGNNGGDGLVIAHHAVNAGLSVTIAIGETGPNTWQNKLKADARLAWQRLSESHPKVVTFDQVDWHGVDLVVDAFLGSGVTPPAREEALRVIRAMNSAKCPIASIDVPSGLDADRGVPVGEAVFATETLTMIAVKPGLVTADGPEHCGRLWLTSLDLSVPRTPQQVIRWLRFLSSDWRLQSRHLNSHKGSFGHVGVIGGDVGMGGAGLMAAQAALRSGAGKVTWWTHAAHVSAALARCPELMVQTRSPTDAKTATLLKQHDVIVFGPGLGRGDWAKAWAAQVEQFDGPLIVDADGLLWLERITGQDRPCIITPHPGEAAQLLKCDVSDIQADRYWAVETLARQYACVAVLKGCGTLVSDGKCTNVSSYGCPAMAVAGMGDMLAGMIGAILAQSHPPMHAALLGVMAHGLSGMQAAETWHNGLVATDVLAHVPNYLWE